MKNALLFIAISLAILINGLVIYDTMAVVGVDTPIVVVPEEATPVEPVPDELVEEGLVSMYCTVPKKESIPDNDCYQGHNQSCNHYYYNNGCRWQYHRGQPVRNVVRFFHNRRPVRRALGWIFGVRRCW
jgi:hypothetical protein